MSEQLELFEKDIKFILHTCFHDGLTKLGVKLAKLALAEPELFRY